MTDAAESMLRGSATAGRRLCLLSRPYCWTRESRRWGRRTYSFYGKSEITDKDPEFFRLIVKV